MNVVDVVIITSAVLSLGLLGVGVRFLRDIHLSIESRLRRIDSFISPNGDEPSNLAITFDVLVERAFAKVAGHEMGRASGLARSEKSAQVDYIKSVVSQEQPMIAMALDQVFPKWGKMLANNPQMIDQLMGYLQNMGKKGEAPSGNNVKQQQRLFSLGGE